MKGTAQNPSNELSSQELKKQITELNMNLAQLIEYFEKEKNNVRYYKNTNHWNTSITY